MITSIGDRHTFCIEYSIEQCPPPFGRVRLWINNLWIGDISRTMFLAHLGSSIESLLVRDPRQLPCLFATQDEAPSPEDALAGDSWFWGDVFDDFFFSIYAIQADSAIHVVWELHESRQHLFPEYPGGGHHARVPYAVFDAVATEFLRSANLGCVDRSG